MATSGRGRANTRYNFWRPVTAVHLAGSDGNAETAGDPTWTPSLGFTYPMPDHDSAHSVQGGAAAEVLKQFFGTDRIRFKACSLTLPAGASVRTRPRACVRIPVFQKRPTKTDSRASWSAFTSAARLTKASITVGRSEAGRSSTSSAQCKTENARLHRHRDVRYCLSMTMISLESAGSEPAIASDAHAFHVWVQAFCLCLCAR